MATHQNVKWLHACLPEVRLLPLCVQVPRVTYVMPQAGPAGPRGLPSRPLLLANRAQQPLSLQLYTPGTAPSVQYVLLGRSAAPEAHRFGVAGAVSCAMQWHMVA